MIREKVSFKWAFKEFIWPRRKIVFLGLILIVIKSLAGFVLPLQIQKLIDEIVPNGNMKGLYILLGLVVGALFIQAVTSFFLTRY